MLGKAILIVTLIAHNGHRVDTDPIVFKNYAACNTFGVKTVEKYQVHPDVFYVNFTCAL